MANEHDNSGLILPSSGAGVGVKGAYVEVIASLSFNTIWLWASLARASTFPIGPTVQVDLAIGSIGSEVIKIPDWPMQAINSGIGGMWGITYSQYFGRLLGERISCRVADDSGAAEDYLFQFLFWEDKLTTTVP